ncbi:hypothetical protein L1987_13560 [Smallanthus sonchifolius]|uniref:Uncharacterized protein n=1 Tax=Smallanthus sonchifolius TaxID=185202 RepID=A0ACB9JH91_9ASTR|nr:hypothetical protein L1987_13560 [Smallanthus sonchifolius]
MSLPVVNFVPINACLKDPPKPSTFDGRLEGESLSCFYPFLLPELLYPLRSLQVSILYSRRGMARFTLPSRPYFATFTPIIAPSTVTSFKEEIQLSTPEIPENLMNPKPLPAPSNLRGTYASSRLPR